MSTLAKDYRQLRTPQYPSRVVDRGRNRLQHVLTKMREVTAIELEKGCVRRIDDREPMDKFYVQTTLQSKVSRRIRSLLQVYKEEKQGEWIVYTIAHASYLYAQDTLSNRFQMYQARLVELCILASFLLLLYHTTLC